MYLVRTDISVRPSDIGEFEASQARLAQSAKGLPGMLSVTLLHSYRHINKYTITARYESAEAAWGFYKSEPFGAYVKGQPPGRVTVTQNECYESVFDVNRDGATPGPQADCETLIDWMLNPGASDAFERTRREFFELRKQQTKGFVSSRLHRSAGTPGKYLVIHIYTDAEAARAAVASPDLAAWQREHPYSLYAAAPAPIETYQVVHRVM
jgi:heme-degrading monooxygenase HmoA